MENIKVVDPNVALRLTTIPQFWLTGVERKDLKVPVAPNGQISDATPLEDPKDPSKKFYWAGYAVVTEATTHGPQYAVRFHPKGKGWELSVTLVKAPPMELLRANPGAAELPLELALLLRFRQRVNGQPVAVSEVAFTSATVQGDQVQGVLAIESLPRRDEIYAAMTDPALACSVVVRRKAQVAVPLPAPPRGLRVVPRPKVGGGVEFVPDPSPPPPPPPPRYRQTERVLDQAIPFTFERALNGYIFDGIGAVTPGNQGLLRKQINWNGQPYVYYQDDGDRNKFFYLPDTFKLARRPAVPHEPLMSVRFDSVDGSKAKMQATLSYCAVPFVSTERLASALATMQSMVPQDVLANGTGIELEPLLPDPAKIVLKLAFPGSETADGPFAPRPHATVNLRSGIIDALTLSLDQFRTLFDAMFSQGQLLFSGSVEFDMGGTGEQIPFQLRFQSPAEPFARWTNTSNGDGVLLELVNEIESKLSVTRLDAILRLKNNLEIKPLKPVSGDYPVQVEPARTVQFRIPEIGDETIENLDFSAVECVPNREAIYNLVLDPSALPAYLRDIKVKTFKPTFAEPPANPKNQILSVVVDFESGDSVELTADHLEASVRVPVPLAGFILGQPEATLYRYKVTVARLEGATADTNWRTGDSAILFPPVS